ncbi:MAG: Asp23/Gls24 family envelope stress response protein [Clostridia bacterium]|nr:Asp23/Gls24 family envelope stress response protein [Clostridia bacterium]
MDANEFKTAEGSCIISEDVIASIVATAALETEGVTGLANRPADLRGIMNQNAAARSVRVLNTENDTVLDVYVTILQGARIQETAVALQQNIKLAVQSMTGKPVTRVNVHVEGMTMTEEKNDD